MLWLIALEMAAVLPAEVSRSPLATVASLSWPSEGATAASLPEQAWTATAASAASLSEQEGGEEATTEARTATAAWVKTVVTATAIEGEAPAQEGEAQ